MTHQAHRISADVHVPHSDVSHISSPHSAARVAFSSEAAVHLSSPSHSSDSAASVTRTSGTSDASPQTSRVLAALDFTHNQSDRTVRPNSLSSDQSIAQMAGSGRFGRLDAGQEVARPGDGQTPPTLKVQYQTAESMEQVPDFVVHKDGSIDVVGDPNAKLNQKDLVVMVERAPGELEPSQAQQQATQELSRYLSDQIKTRYPQAAQQGVNFEDKQNIVPDEAERGMGARNNNGLQNLPEQTRRQVEDMNRFGGGGQGRMDRSRADDYFPERTVPREASESQKLAAMKDVVAGFNTRGIKEPYEHVGNKNGERAFGRYGMTFNQVSNWLESLDLEAMEELERQGKLPKGTCAKLKKMKDAAAKHKEHPNEKIEDPFLSKLKGENPNDPLTAADIKEFFPKELQEHAANDMVRAAAKDAQNPDGTLDVGKIALTMQLGRPATQEDMARPESQEFLKAAKQAYQISEQRMTNGGGPIDWTDANGRLLSAAQNSVGRVMWGDFASVVQNGRLGCAASVTKVAEMAGITGIRSAGVTDFAAQAQRRGFERYSVSQARPGDIVYGVEPGGGGGGSAHIGIVGQDGRVYHNSSRTGRWTEANLSSVFNRGRFGNQIYVLRAPQA